MPVLESLIDSAAGGLLGIGFGEINDARQVRQQKRMNRASREHTEWLMDKQVEMWNRTGYGAQKEQMEKAGLNPALMYGMGGGGGSTTNVETADAGKAPSGGMEMMGMQQMNLMRELQAAQIENIKADTAQKEVITEKTSGVDTQEGQARIDALLQGVDNARQQNEIQKLEITLKNMENFEKQASQADRLDYIEYQAGQAMKQLEIVRNEAYISSKTIREKVQIIQQEAVGAVLKNALTGEMIKSQQTGRAVDQQRIKESANSIMMKWDSLERTDREILLKQVMTQFNTDLSNDMFKETLDVLGQILEGSARKR